MACRFGSLSYKISKVKPFSTPNSGTVIVPLNCFRMRLAPKAMALSLVSIGFSARGRIRENIDILILRSWEFFPIVIALRIWGPLMADKCIIFRTDNAVFVDIINQQTSKPKLVMALVRA